MYKLMFFALCFSTSLNTHALHCNAAYYEGDASINFTSTQETPMLAIHDITEQIAKKKGIVLIGYSISVGTFEHLLMWVKDNVDSIVWIITQAQWDSIKEKELILKDTVLREEELPIIVWNKPQNRILNINVNF